MILRLLLLMILQIQMATSLCLANIERSIWDKFYTVPPLENSLLQLQYNTDSIEDEGNINILVWNMYKGKNASWSQDFEKLASSSDLLMLQEVSWQKSMQDAFHNLALNLDLAISFISQKTLEATGVANAGKSIISESKIFRSTFQETLVKTPKMIAASYIELPQSQKKLLLVNIHGVNFVTTNALAHQLKEVAPLVKEHQGPVVFAGDFNTWSKDKTELVLNLMKDLNMQEVSFPVDNRKKTFGYPLDYIFYRDLKLLEAKSYSDILGSDHTPMRAIFSAL